MPDIIRYFFTLLILWVNISVNAQNRDFTKYVGIGVHGGINFSEVKFSEVASDESDITSFKALRLYSGGLLLNFMAEEYAGIQVEVNFSKRGWTEIKDSAYTYKRSINFLEIPLLTHLSFGKNHFKYIFNLGPYVAFERSFKETYELFDSNSSIPESDSSNYFGKSFDNPIDLGFMFDAGLGIKTDIGIFQVKARYSHGILSVFDEYPDGEFRASKMQNISIELSYVYNFYLGQKD
jgi:hypothetical protein